MVEIVRDVPLNSRGYVYVLEVFCMSVMSALSVSIQASIKTVVHMENILIKGGSKQMENN